MTVEAIRVFMGSFLSGEGAFVSSGALLRSVTLSPASELAFGFGCHPANCAFHERLHVAAQKA
jgi:hypothetical protein